MSLRLLLRFGHVSVEHCLSQLGVGSARAGCGLFDYGGGALP